MFSAILLFHDGLDDSSATEHELRAAGFEYEILDEIDPVSNAVFARITHLGEIYLLDQVEEIVGSFNGECLKAISKLPKRKPVGCCNEVHPASGLIGARAPCACTCATWVTKHNLTPHTADSAAFEIPTSAGCHHS
jgi:hypothetical protein